MNTKSDSPEEQATNQADTQPTPDAPEYPDPTDGIALHIEELKQNLETIHEQTGVDPNLLPEIEPEEDAQ
ncbi:hypothetical protein [Spirosoma koreense]